MSGPADSLDQTRSAAALIRRVGERVREARERKAIPRRVLSEISGVSPRYLAQLEAGEGNISIGLLQRVAAALDTPIDALIGEAAPLPPEALLVAERFGAASPETRDEVLRLLDPAPASGRRAQRICLLGLRGAGKSTLGALAAARLGVPFLELNREIEAQSGMPVEEVMALYGPEGYRRLEAQAVDQVIAGQDRLILEVAGGVVAEPETYGRLLARFHTVWIRTSPDEHMARVRAQGDERPMAGNPEAMERLKSLLTSREALYGRALAQLDTSCRRVGESLEALLALIAERRFLG